MSIFYDRRDRWNGGRDIDRENPCSAKEVAAANEVIWGTATHALGTVTRALVRWFR